MKLATILRVKYNQLPPEKKPLAVFFIALCCLLLLILGIKSIYALAALHKTPPQPLLIREDEKIQIPAYSALRKEIILQTIRKMDRPHTLIFPGIVEADPASTINIFPPLAGKLVSLQVKLGDTVKANQVLAELHSPALAQIEANYTKAKSLVQFTSEVLKRTKEVYRIGGNTIKDVQLAQNDYNQAVADLDQMKATLETFKVGPHSTLKIIAPTEGRVIALNYGQGTFINDIATPLLTVSNLNTVWVTANIPEHLAGIVTKHQKVTVYLSAYPDQKINAEITFVNSFLEPDTRRNKTRIALANPHGKFQPNMFASIHIHINQPNIIMIPITAILMNNDTVSVFVETAPWTFERREVQLGTEDGEYVRIIAGLKEDDKIVTCGGVLIND